MSPTKVTDEPFTAKTDVVSVAGILVAAAGMVTVYDCPGVTGIAAFLA
jgi:hypothetical protein